MNIDNLKLKKKLGSGMFGTTYLTTYKNKDYAIKIEKIAEKNINYDLRIQDWREIDFSLNFANKYPDQFIMLYAYDVINNCKHVQEYYNNQIPQHLPSNVIVKLKEKQESKYCIRKVYSLVDTTFSKIYDNITKEQYYSCLAQISYIAFLMKNSGYTHNDLHGENLGVLYVNKNKKLNILNTLIPTFGLQFKAIDFGTVLNTKYKLNKKENLIYKYNLEEEINRIIRRIVSFEKSEFFFTKLITSDKFPEIFAEVKKHLLFKATTDLTKNIQNRFLLFQILFPEEFQKILLKDKFTNTIHPKLKIDLTDFIFLLNNTSNYKKIIHFCSYKLN